VPDTLLAHAICTIHMGEHHLGGVPAPLSGIELSESPMQHADATIAGLASLVFLKQRTLGRCMIYMKECIGVLDV